MRHTVKVALAQVDLAVGDVAGNTKKIIAYAVRAAEELEADLVVFPELSVCGYPPEDLLLHAGLRHGVEAAVEEIRGNGFRYRDPDRISGIRRRTHLQRLRRIQRR